jgi:hypothetical protein
MCSCGPRQGELVVGATSMMMSRGDGSSSRLATATSTAAVGDENVEAVSFASTALTADSSG